MDNKNKILGFLLAFLIGITLTSGAAAAETANSIPADHIVMVQDGAVRVMILDYFPNTASDLILGEHTPVTIYKALNAKTGKYYIVMAFVNKRVCENFISSGEDINRVTSEVNKFGTDNKLTPYQVETMLYKYAGTNDRSGVKRFRLNGSNNVDNFAIAFRADPAA